MIKKMMHKFLKTITSIINLLSILLFHTILFFSFFSESVRLNLAVLVSDLLSGGVIGLYVILIMTNFIFPNFKLWYFMFQEKNLNMLVYKKTMTTSNVEKKLSKWIYLYSPFILFVYFFITS